MDICLDINQGGTHHTYVRMYSYRFLSHGFMDWREILHGGFGLIADSFSPILEDSPRDGQILGVNRGHML